MDYSLFHGNDDALGERREHLKNDFAGFPRISNYAASKQLMPTRHPLYIEANRPKIHVSVTMSKDRSKCAYCGRPASTSDHVPPESLFTPPRPSNLITVPACGDCNHGASDDDEVFRNELTIMAGSFRESANAAERLQPTMRAILRKRATRENIVSEAKPVERYSMGGIYLGPGYAVLLNSDVHKRVLTRILRGLYWNQTGNSLANDVHVDLMSIDKTTPNWQAIFDIPRRLRLQNVLVGDGDTFQYFWGNARDDPIRSIWLLMFFKGPSAQIIVATTSMARSGTELETA